MNKPYCLDEAVEAMLGENPEAWGTRLVYADWLEEQGDTDLAVAMRWMATWTVAPRRVGVSRHAWYGARALRPSTLYPLGVQISAAVLADELFDLMTGYDFDTPLKKTWPTRRGAERALALALKDAGAAIR